MVRLVRSHQVSDLENFENVSKNVVLFFVVAKIETNLMKIIFTQHHVWNNGEPVLH